MQIAPTRSSAPVVPANCPPAAAWSIGQRRKDRRPSKPFLLKSQRPCPRRKILLHLRWPAGNLRFANGRAGNLLSKDRSEKIPRRSPELRSNPRPEESLPSCRYFLNQLSLDLRRKDRRRGVSLF